VGMVYTCNFSALGRKITMRSDRVVYGQAVLFVVILLSKQ